jgi:hypothetical protein
LQPADLVATYRKGILCELRELLARKLNGSNGFG